MESVDKALWTTDFDTGIAVVDSQHKRLFALYNRLVELIESEQNTKAVISDLIDYTEYHFSCEEALMEQYNYPETAFHMDQHTTFIGEIMELIQKQSVENAAAYLRAFANFLKSWLQLAELLAF